jgi:hypothetical protein
MTEDDPASTESTSPSDESPPQSSTLNNAISRVVPDNPVKSIGDILLHVAGVLIAMFCIGLIVYTLRHTVPTDIEQIQAFYLVIAGLAGLGTYLRYWPDYIHETPSRQSWRRHLDSVFRAFLDAVLFYSILILAMLVLAFFSLQSPPYDFSSSAATQLWVVFKAITLIPLTVFIVKSFKSMRAQALNTVRPLYLDQTE